MPERYDVICIGAGPTGLACAIDARLEGLTALVIDKGCVCNSLYHYPTNMFFFTTPERMEIGELPMTIFGSKPTRAEALKYYRRAVDRYEINVRQYETVERIEGRDGEFAVHTRDDHSRTHSYHSRKIIIATGFYDHPNPVGVPGEDLPHVSHYFTEPHPYWKQDVVVIGGGNSAAETALELFRAGSQVTIVHRGAEMAKGLKYWVRPDIDNRIAAGEIRALFNTKVVRIEPGQVVVSIHGKEETIPAAHVFALTGYHPDFDFLERAGIHLDAATKKPQVNTETLETNVRGIYVAGVVVGGLQTSRIFIENGRFHGRQIIAAIAGKGKLPDREPVAAPGE
ncbi:MAG: YpdA family putative bacillithiol disulfide reductase [Candidatus Acidiferrales bacterium]